MYYFLLYLNLMYNQYIFETIVHIFKIYVYTFIIVTQILYFKKYDQLERYKDFQLLNVLL